MKIRQAKKEDIEKIHSIAKKVKEFQVDPNMEGFWSKKDLEKWAKSKKDVFLVAEDNKQIVGFVTFTLHVPTGKVVFENAWVHRDYRKKRLASKLYREGIKQIKKKGGNYLIALVKEDAKSSMVFLKKNNFKKGYKFWWFHKPI